MKKGRRDGKKIGRMEGRKEDRIHKDGRRGGK